MRSFSFSNNGRKIFIFDQDGNDEKHSIKEYSLSSSFDLSNPTLVTEYVGHNSDLNSIAVSYTHLTLPTKRIV